MSSTGRKMKAVLGETTGIEFIRASRLTGPATLVEEALYLGSVPNQFDEDKSDYKFETGAGKLVVINGAGNLGYQMSKIEPNTVVTIKYNGRQKIAKGKLAGKESHNFQVLAEAE